MSASDYYASSNAGTPAPLTGTITTSNVASGANPILVTPPVAGHTHVDSASGDLFIFDGQNWIKVGALVGKLNLQAVACDKYRGRKARKCDNCGVKYVDHEEGQVAYLRERLLAMQRKVREL